MRDQWHFEVFVPFFDLSFRYLLLYTFCLIFGDLAKVNKNMFSCSFTVPLKDFVNTTLEHKKWFSYFCLIWTFQKIFQNIWQSDWFLPNETFGKAWFSVCISKDYFLVTLNETYATTTFKKKIKKKNLWLRGDTLTSKSTRVHGTNLIDLGDQRLSQTFFLTAFWLPHSQL